MTNDDDDLVDPWRRHLERQPIKKTDVDILVQHIMMNLEELQSLLPPEDDDIDEDNEPDDPDLVACKRRVNKLRRELRGLKRK